MNNTLIKNSLWCVLSLTALMCSASWIDNRIKDTANAIKQGAANYQNSKQPSQSSSNFLGFTSAAAEQQIAQQQLAQQQQALAQQQAQLAQLQKCQAMLPAVVTAFLNTLRNAPAIDAYLQGAATDPVQAAAWLYNYQPARDAGCVDLISADFWAQIQGPAQQILAQRNVQPATPVTPTSFTAATSLRGATQQSKYFTNSSGNVMSVLLIDIAGAPHQVTVPRNSQGVITFSQAGPTVQRISVTLQGQGGGTFYVRGAGQMGSNDKGDLAANNYIINGVNNYNAQ